MKRFIFYRNDRLGDFIIITSIINKIKEVYKKSHITVVCSPKNYDLIKSYPIVDKIFIYDKRKSFLKRITGLEVSFTTPYLNERAVWMHI